MMKTKCIPFQVWLNILIVLYKVYSNLPWQLRYKPCNIKIEMGSVRFIDHHFLFPLTRKVWMNCGLEFFNSFSEILQSWFLSKYLNICLKFFGVFFKNWFEMWYSDHLIYLSLSISKASNIFVAISALEVALMVSSCESESTSPTHFSTELRTNIRNMHTNFWS